MNRNGLALVPDLFHHILLNAVWSKYVGYCFSYTDHVYTRFVAQQGVDFICGTGPTVRALVLTP
jgi:hypothetical protein